MAKLSKLGVALATVVMTLLLAEFASRWRGMPEAQATRVADLRAFLERGHEVFVPWLHSGYVVKNKAASQHTRPVNWSFDYSKDSDVLRVACLGGSTTHGGYPKHLSDALDEATGESVRVMNWGVPGWTTSETMVNYFTNVQDYGPDVIVIHHAVNDIPPRRTVGFRSDYAHYRRPWAELRIPAWKRWLVKNSHLYASLQSNDENQLKLNQFVAFPDKQRISADGPADTLPAGTAHAFRRNIRSIILHAQAMGTRVLLMTMPYRPSDASPAKDGSKRVWLAGLEEHNQILRELAATYDCALADAATWVAESPEECESLFVDRVHVKSKGMKGKSSLIVEALEARGWLEPKTQERPQLNLFQKG